MMYKVPFDKPNCIQCVNDYRYHSYQDRKVRGNVKSKKMEMNSASLHGDI